MASRESSDVEDGSFVAAARGRHRRVEVRSLLGGSPTTWMWIALAIVVVSRWLAFPASIWDMDEANFALGVIAFDPVHNQPHAPFFPLWIALGKIVRWFAPGVGPAEALQVVSAVFSVVVMAPLVSLWSEVLPRFQALAATMLYLFLPGVWLLSGRAYTEPAAIALMVTAVTAWLPSAPSRRGFLIGSVAVIAMLLIRPQWLPMAMPLVVWRLVRCASWVERAIVAGIPVVVGGAAIALVARSAGGLGPLWEAVERHQAYIKGAAAGFDWSFAGLGVHAVAGGLVAGSIWLVLAVVGSVALVRDRSSRRAAGVLLGLVLAPHVLLLLTVQNPTLPRYALPVLALTAGSVVAGIRVVLTSPRWTVAAVFAWVAGCVVVTAPVLGVLRSEPSPVIAAFDRIEAAPAIEAVVADRRLVAFVTFEQARGRLRKPLLWDYQVELGMIASPFRNDLAAIATDPDPPWISHPGRVTTFSCHRLLLRRIMSPRFLDLTVIEGCGLVKPDNPSIRLEDLRPGAVIPAPEGR